MLVIDGRVDNLAIDQRVDVPKKSDIRPVPVQQRLDAFKRYSALAYSIFTNELVNLKTSITLRYLKIICLQIAQKWCSKMHNM